MGIGRPMAWPTIWSFCDLAKRVKSGMLSASVAQKPTSPVSAAQVLGPPSTTLAGRLKSSPAGTFIISTTTSRMDAPIISGAAITSSRRIDSGPFQMNQRCTAQNARKHTNCEVLMVCPSAGPARPMPRMFRKPCSASAPK
ncbi:hypothetical protein D9M69_542800 [compost metagenome]